MKFTKITLITMLLVLFSGHSLATNIDEWDYESITGNLKQTPGCKDKVRASKQASTGLRFKKYTKLLCGSKGYGWGIDKVLDNGEIICDECEGDYEDTEKYRCYVKDVKVQCKRVVR